MNEKLKNCDSCGAEIATSAKTCPQCGAKVKRPITRKWWFWVIIVVVIAAIAGGASGSNSNTPSGADTSAAGTSTTDKPASADKPAAEQPVSYTHYNVTELFDALSDNAMKAQSDFKDQYVEIEGYLRVIDSDGKYIGVGAASDNFDYILQTVQCYIKNDTQKQQIMEISKDSPIVVRGKIKTVGEIQGYSLNIDSIN